jgi:putative transposase
MKTNRHFNAGYASSMQQVCIGIGEAFKSFKKLLALYCAREIEQKPKPPKYRKSGGMFAVTCPKCWLKLEPHGIRFPLGKQVKAWFGIEEFFLPLPVNLEWESIKEIRILTRNKAFHAEFVYSVEKEVCPLDPKLTLGIDPAMNIPAASGRGITSLGSLNSTLRTL